METYEEWEAKNRARIEAMHKAINDEMDTLLIHYSQEELEKRFFKDFGCVNFISDEARHELMLAHEFHARHKALHPDLHDEHEVEPYNCYHVTTCKCGFKEACDSSD